MFRKVLKKYSNIDDFEKNIATVLSGTMISQLLVVGSSLILTRQYSVPAFGVFTLFMVLTNLVVQFAAARYEMAIILPQKDEIAANIVGLSLFIVLSMCALCLLIACIGSDIIISKLNNAAIRPYLYVVPIHILFLGFWNTLIYWNIRRANFKTTAKFAIIRAVITVVISVSLGFLTNNEIGLITGLVVGQAVSTVLLTNVFFEDVKRLNLSFKGIFQKKEMRQTAMQHINFPKFQLPSVIAESFSGQIPHIVFSTNFNATVLGWFGMAGRMVNFPLDLIGSSIRTVFQERANRDYIEHGNCRPIYLSTLKKLFLLSLLPMLCIATLSPILFSVVLGASWRESGVYAQLLTGMFFFRFLSSPLSSIFYIAEKQHIDMFIQLTVLSIQILVFFIFTYAVKSPEVAIHAYGIIYSLKYITEGYLSYFFAKK